MYSLKNRTMAGMLALLMLLSMTGCAGTTSGEESSGSTVTQEEYDALKEQNEQLQAELDKLKEETNEETETESGSSSESESTSTSDGSSSGSSTSSQPSTPAASGSSQSSAPASNSSRAAPSAPLHPRRLPLPAARDLWQSIL